MLIFRPSVSHKAKRCHRFVMNYLSFSCAAVVLWVATGFANERVSNYEPKLQLQAEEQKEWRQELCYHNASHGNVLLFAEFCFDSSRHPHGKNSTWNRVRDAPWGITHFELYCYFSCFYLKWRKNWRQTVTGYPECFASDVLTTACCAAFMSLRLINVCLRCSL
jgi:hypothetical protein